VHPSVPANRGTELIEYARANPGKLNFGSANATSLLGPLLLMSSANLEMNGIPYKGEALALTICSSGRLHLMFHLRDAHPARQGRQAPRPGHHARLEKPAAARSPHHGRSGPASHFPSILDSARRAGQEPREIIERLSRETNLALRRPGVRAQLDNQAFETAGSTPEEMGAVMRQQLDAWRRAVGELRIKVD